MSFRIATPPQRFARGFRPPAWLQISTLIFRLDPLLDRLDRGEQGAILLAESLKAERLIIDDLEDRRDQLYKQPTFM